MVEQVYTSSLKGDGQKWLEGSSPSRRTQLLI